MIPDVPVTDELLHALPKTDLHCHLDGSLRLQTMLELADQQQIRLPADTVDGLARAMKIGERHGSLEEYLKGFDITLSVLQTEEALYRAAYELGIDAAAENCKLIEVRYAPVLHLQKGLKPTVVVEAVLEGLRAATRETGILAGVLVCGIRNMSPETSLRLAELSVADMATHPFKFYLDFGIRVTINTDNRLITDTTVTKELSIVSKQFGLNASDIRNILVAGFKSSFLTFHDRAQLVRKVQSEMDELISRFAERNGVPKKAAASKPPPSRPAAGKPSTSKPPSTRRDWTPIHRTTPPPPIAAHARGAYPP